MHAAQYPPFADLGDRPLPLPTSERRRSGHVYGDCPLFGLEAPRTAGKRPVKPEPCEPCTLRARDEATFQRDAQRRYDAEWLASREPVPQAPAPAVPAPRVVAPAHRPNKFAGKCLHCSEWVDAQAGALGKDRTGKWSVAHIGSCPVQLSPEASTATVPAAQLRAGAYRLTDGRIIRVQMSKMSGNPYAVSLDSARMYLGGGKLLQGAVRLSLDEAKAYGRETGTCCVCGAHLENPESVALGIGPICGGRQ